jgi:hypothetical protein
MIEKRRRPQLSATSDNCPARAIAAMIASRTTTYLAGCGKWLGVGSWHQILTRNWVPSVTFRATASNA